MSLKGVKCILGYVSMADHEKCMVERDGPPCGYSPTLLQLMTRTKPERADIKFSPSSLGNCHRRTVLGRQHDWFLDVDSAYRMIRGSVIHAGLENEPAPPGVLGVIRELKMSAPINVNGEEHTFHGTFDELTLLSVEQVRDDTLYPEPLTHMGWKNVLHVKLVDYKSKSEVLHTLVEPDEQHVYQINSYAWMVQQFLPKWLNWQTDLGWPNCDGCMDVDTEHLFMNDGVQLPNVDEVVIDELSIVYLDMKKVRTFTSKGFGYANGKMKGTMSGGHWHRNVPTEYETLELMPIHQFTNKFIEEKIRKGIERQIESETILAAPLTGDRAELMCRSCPVLVKCVEVGKAEGHDMKEQEKFCGECD